MDWTSEEEAILLELYKLHDNRFKRIADDFFKLGHKTSADAVRCKLRRLGVLKTPEVKVKALTIEAPQFVNIPEVKQKHTFSLETSKHDIVKVAALYDSHFPETIRINPLLNFLKDFKPNIFIFGGDNWSMDCISHWREKEFRNEGMNNVIDQFNEQRDRFIAQIDKFIDACPQAHFVYITGNHECLDMDTELYTDNGWIKYEEISYSHKVLSINPENEKPEFVPIDRIIIKDHDGLLNHIDTRTIDLMATDDHKIFQKNRQTQKYEYVKVKDLSKTRYQIPVSTQFDNPEYPLTDDEIKISAWIITDGHITKARGYCGFTQRESKHHLITNILDSLGWAYHKRIREKHVDSICGKVLLTQEPSVEINLNSEVSKKLTDIAGLEKTVPAWTNNLSKRQFDLFLSTLIDADGSRHPSAPETSWMLYKSKEFLEDIQILCIKNGHSASISKYGKGHYRLNICVGRKLFSYETKPHNFKKVPYKGKVWDLTVKNHNFLIRRNGKCHFTGNCWLDGFVSSFPQIEKVNLTTILKRAKKFIEIVPLGGFYNVGKLYFAHGDQFGTANPAKQAVERCGKTVVFGHHHTTKVWCNFSMVDEEEKHLGIQVPCYTTLSPDYGRGKPNAWLNGFFTACVKKDSGKFSPFIQMVSPSGTFMSQAGHEYN